MAFGKAKKVVTPSWHQDFRDFETLPDVKTIRTDFIYNSIGIFVAVIVVGLFIINEFKSFALNSSIKELNVKITEDTGTNGKFIQDSDAFGQFAIKTTELDKFVQVPLRPGDLLLTLTENLPEALLLQGIVYDTSEMAIDRKKWLAKTINLQGNVTGSPEEATQVVNDYVESLESLEMLEGLIEKVQLRALNRDEKLGMFNFTIVVQFNPLK